jgi:hypothetical protein
VLRYYVVEFIFFGVVAANGVVIATEKKLPSILIDESSVSKLFFFFSVLLYSLVEIQETLLFFCVFYCVFFVNFSGWPCDLLVIT